MENEQTELHSIERQIGKDPGTSLLTLTNPVQLYNGKSSFEDFHDQLSYLFNLWRMQDEWNNGNKADRNGAKSDDSSSS